MASTTNDTPFDTCPKCDTELQRFGASAALGAVMGTLLLLLLGGLAVLGGVV